MPAFENTVTINRPAEEVFAYLADAENIPRWNYAIEQTRKITPGPVGVGTVYRQTRTIPRRSQEEFEIVAFQPPGQLALDGTFGPFKARTSYLIEPITGGTSLTNRWDLELTPAPLRLLGPVAIPRVKAAVAENMRTLKHILENDRGVADRIR
ncbi:MAG: SRPBCC family protein [Actinobacteria bacterium]|nr:SRPBCC family protein [Actinomycetota bacterium]